MQTLGVAGRRKLIAERALREQRRRLGEELKMLLGRLPGNKQEEHLPDGLAVRRVERNRLARSHECRKRVVEPLDASVRDGDALAQAGRAELLAREETVEYGR